jgi:hypothetical protein
MQLLSRQTQNREPLQLKSAAKYSTKRDLSLEKRPEMNTSVNEEQPKTNHQLDQPFDMKLYRKDGKHADAIAIISPEDVNSASSIKAMHKPI